MVDFWVEICALVSLPDLFGQGHLGQQGFDALFQWRADPQPWALGVASLCGHRCAFTSACLDTSDGVATSD